MFIATFDGLIEASGVRLHVGQRVVHGQYAVVPALAGDLVMAYCLDAVHAGAYNESVAAVVCEGAGPICWRYQVAAHFFARISTGTMRGLAYHNLQKGVASMVPNGELQRIAHKSDYWLVYLLLCAPPQPPLGVRETGWAAYWEVNLLGALKPERMVRVCQLIWPEIADA